MRGLVWASAAGSFAIYGLAIRRFFSRPDGVPPKMRALSFTGSVGAVIHLATIGLGPLQPTPWPTVALVTYLAALGLFTWAWSVTRHAPLPIAFSRTPSPRLVTEGPFRVLRHPFYLAYSGTWLAGVVVTGSWIAALCSATIVSFYVTAAREENRWLEARPGRRFNGPAEAE